MRITVLTRAILDELPDIVQDYIQAIQDTTQPLTRYAYAQDIRIFIQYLTKENPNFALKAPISWTNQDFSKIKARDIAQPVKVTLDNTDV